MDVVSALSRTEKNPSSVQMSSTLENMSELALRDEVHVLTNANKELQRLLKKAEQTIDAFANPPNPPPLGKCSNCVSHYEAFDRTRKSNGQEWKWVMRFLMTREEKRTCQDEKLKEITDEYENLKRLYNDLKQRKDDPYCRDTEIAKIRVSLEEMKERFLNANHAAFSANCEAKKFLSDLEVEKERVQKLEIMLRASEEEKQQMRDTIETYKQAPELKDLPVASCTDFRCRKRNRDAYLEHCQFEERVSKLSKENHELKDEVKRCESDVSSLLSRIENGSENSSGLPHVFMILEQNKKPTKANLENYGELVRRLKTFFIFYPAHDEEYEEATMYMDFLLDIPEAKRLDQIRSMYGACHEGKQIPESTAERFKQRSEQKKPELICRSCFVACMLALGGNFVKHGNKTVWVNVRAARRPLYA